MMRAEALLQELLNHLEEGIHIVDKDGRTIYYNEAMGKIEGLEPKEVLGKKVVELIDGLEESNSTLMNAINYKIKYKDVIQKYNDRIGKEIVTINSTIPVIQGNQVIAAIEISKNMTLLKELNEKICKLENGRKVKRKHYRFKDIVTVNINMQREINKGKKAALSKSSVLIYGETGCGKEIFAQSIHFDGLRKEKPFVPVNCAAIPKELLEGILFGTVKGSFTGAENRKGLFEEAHGGTILLDEINSMNIDLQTKLLRVLQEGYIRPLGSKEDKKIDVRIIATINEEAETLIKEGRLRKDLFYRLGVIKINIPPLRQRKEDIPNLVKYFINYYNSILSKRIITLEEEVLRNFINYNWPGNVRELRNSIEAAMNMIEDNMRILTKEYFDIHEVKREEKAENSKGYLEKKNFSMEKYLEDIEANLIKEALLEKKNNISKAAEYLNISRQSLQYKIKKYKLL